jgi:hypothetical protein
VSIVLYELCAADERRLFSPHCWTNVLAPSKPQSRPVPFTRIREIGDGFSETVPILDDGGRLVRDSWDIAIYLEDTYPNAPTLFGGPGGRAIAKFVEGWALAVVHPMFFR